MSDPAAADRPDYTRLFRLDGRTALVVGGGSGIGRESALALAANGARVVVADRDVDAARETASLGEGLEAYPLDITDSAAVEQAARDLDGPDGSDASDGGVDVLVITAGVNVRKHMLDYSGEEFDKVVGVNLRAHFDLIRAFGRGMADRGRGSIIAFSSMRAVLVEPGQSVYAATKAGLVQLLRTAAAELGPRGVRCNAIAPGVVDTPLTTQIKSDPAWRDAYAQASALGRWAHPSELAGAVVYLASDAASFVTGSQLFVDAGWTAVDGRFDPFA